LNAAAALGFVEKRDGLFSNSAAAEAELTSGGAMSIASSLKLESEFYQRWGRLSESVRTGGRVHDDRQGERADEHVRNFIYGLYAAARPAAPLVAEALALPTGRPIRAIDIGGGHGGYSIALARRYPNLSATVFELPAVVPIAREIIAQEGLSERVLVQEGDFHHDSLGGGYDLALLFGVLNGEQPEQRLPLLQKASAALASGGLLVLRDRVLDDDRAGPVDAAVFALQLLLTTDGGGLDTRGDWQRRLLEAGVEPPNIIEAPGMTLTLAKKAAAAS